MRVVGYAGLKQIYKNRQNIIFRAVRESDGKDVCLKTPVAEFPGARQLSMLAREFDILTALDIPGIPKALELIDTQGTVVLVTEILPGRPVSRMENGSDLPLDTALAMAQGLVEIIGALHRASYCHRDINPNNILWDEENATLSLVDFGSALEFPHKARKMHPRFVEGSRAYMSPEQSGRMNRGLDYRTDFYSLGVLFYQLFTGDLPFTTQDPNELFHCHIAMDPTPPHQVADHIPPALSQLVLKLMAKDPSQRYQSAEGLAVDLATCRTALAETGEIPAFDLAHGDIEDRFVLPEALYGREKEVHLLLDLFNTAQNGQGQMAFVSGTSGVGKTSLVRELYTPLAAVGGYMVSGKFDQFIRHQPYSAMVQALSALVDQLMGEPQRKIDVWKEKIQTALGSNGQVLTELIPELERLIGPQPPVPRLSAAEECTRFNTLISDLFTCFGKHSSTLVIFLDDLQWIDGPSLSLLETLAPVIRNRAIFIIGAYRSNEVPENHPLSLSMPELEKAGSHLTHISIQELAPNALEEMIRDGFTMAAPSAADLNRLLFEKTRGNPLFFKTMLSRMHSLGHFFFDYPNACWDWNLDALNAMPLADNVVDMLKNTITELSDATVELLQLAGGIGNRFSLDLLSRLADQDRSTVAQALQPAVSQGLIQPRDDDFELLTVTQGRDMPDLIFTFAHDRIQQAAYNMIPEGRRSALHWRIGQLISDIPGKADHVDFDAVAQLNQGSEAAREHEKEPLARLNLQAAKQAKKSAAFGVAETCLSHAVTLLAQDVWERDHDLAMAIHLELAEACYLVSRFDQANQLYELIEAHLASDEEKLSLRNMQVKQYHHQGLYPRAVELEYEALSLLGFDLPREDADLLAALEKEQQTIDAILAKTDTEALYHNPEVEDPRHTITQELLFDLFTDGYLLGKGPMIALAAATAARLSMARGNCAMASIGYINYATILCSSGAYEKGHELGRLAVRLADKYQTASLKNFTYHVFSLGINHWLTPLHTSYDYWYEASKLALESGSPYAGWTFLQLAHVLLASGADLERVADRLNTSRNYLKSARMDDIHSLLEIIVERPLAHLTGETKDFTTLDGKSFSTQACVDAFQEAPFFMGHLRYSQLRASLLCGDWVAPAPLKEWLDIIEQTVQAQIIQVDSFLYGALHLSLGCDKGKLEGEGRELFDRILALFDQWAGLCPANFAHKHLIIRAEEARLDKHWLLAMDLYEQARDAALEANFIQDAALADELCGRFWSGLEKPYLVRHYMGRAHARYLRWGATAKAEQLAAAHQLAVPDPAAESLPEAPDSCSISTQLFNDQMDLYSVIKASQAISRHMVLDELAMELLDLAVENAGATRGVLILKQEEDFLIRHHIDKTDPQAEVRGMGQPFAQSDLVSGAMVRYAVNSGNAVVYNATHPETQFARCPHIRKHNIPSAGCVPILRKNHITGILYLENSQLPDAFKPERVELLRIIASQSAISLENARIYHELEKMNQNLESLVAERTRELNDTNTQLNLKNQELEVLSTTDQLTGLFNRRYMEHSLAQAICPAGTDAQPISILMADIDHFKAINDSHGHDVGDQILQAVSRVLKENIRRVDVAGRWGGEEFLLLLITDLEGTLSLAEKLRTRIADQDHPQAGQVTASFGAAQFQEGDTVDALVKRADLGLYAAKDKGRNRVEAI